MFCHNENVRDLIQRAFIFPLCQSVNGLENYSSYQITCVQNLLGLLSDVKNGNVPYVEQYFGIFDILLRMKSHPPIWKLFLDKGALPEMLSIALDHERIFNRNINLTKLFQIVSKLCRFCDITVIDGTISQGYVPNKNSY